MQLLANQHAAAAASERCDTRESTRLPTGCSVRSVRLHPSRYLSRSPACVYVHLVIGLLDSTSDFISFYLYGTYAHIWTFLFPSSWAAHFGCYRAARRSFYVHRTRMLLHLAVRIRPSRSFLFICMYVFSFHSSITSLLDVCRCMTTRLFTSKLTKKVCICMKNVLKGKSFDVK